MCVYIVGVYVYRYFDILLSIQTQKEREEFGEAVIQLVFLVEERNSIKRSNPLC